MGSVGAEVGLKPGFQDLETLDPMFEVLSQAEDIGYDHFFVPETWGRDCVSTIAQMAVKSQEIQFGTAVMPIYSRSPALIGMTAATLQEATDGRFHLCLGASSPPIVENLHGQEFERPLRNLRENIEIIRKVVTGEPIEYEGDIFDVSGFELNFEQPEPAPPIEVAGLGPKSAELAGRFADGWNADHFTHDGFQKRLESFEHGAELGDRDPDEIRVVAGMTCFVDSDPEVARQQASEQYAFTIGAYGPYYRKSLKNQGYENIVDDIYHHWNEDNREKSVEAASKLLDEGLAAWGTPAQVKETIRRRANVDQVDVILLSFANTPTEELSEVMSTFAPSEL